MSYHRTKSGHIELIAVGGHGRPFDWGERPATIIVDDGDGHFDRWKFSGKLIDAARKAAEVTVLHNDGRDVWELRGSTLRCIRCPDDFWLFDNVDEEGQPLDGGRPNTAKYPEIIAW